MSGEDMTWTANLATGHSRVIYRHLKGADYCQTMDALAGVEYSPPVDERQALSAARKLRDLADELIGHFEGR